VTTQTTIVVLGEIAQARHDLPDELDDAWLNDVDAVDPEAAEVLRRWLVCEAARQVAAIEAITERIRIAEYEKRMTCGRCDCYGDGCMCERAA
jgi:hypothetical protein